MTIEKQKKISFRSLKEEKEKAMRKIELRESLRQSYANRFSAKSASSSPRMNPKKLRKIKSLYKKAIILSNEILERKK